MGRYIEAITKGQTTDGTAGRAPRGPLCRPSHACGPATPLHASTALAKLLHLQPREALLLTLAAPGDRPDHVTATERVPAALVQRGDWLEVRPGEAVPADGIVHWGSSYVDEAMVTGEPVPVAKTVGRCAARPGKKPMHAVGASTAHDERVVWVGLGHPQYGDWGYRQSDGRAAAARGAGGRRHNPRANLPPGRGRPAVQGYAQPPPIC
jgi:magnesium-transporting ATPase (P-type)